MMTNGKQEADELPHKFIDESATANDEHHKTIDHGWERTHLRYGWYKYKPRYNFCRPWGIPTSGPKGGTGDLYNLF